MLSTYFFPYLFLNRTRFSATLLQAKTTLRYLSLLTVGLICFQLLLSQSFLWQITDQLGHSLQFGKATQNPVYPPFFPAAKALRSSEEILADAYDWPSQPINKLSAAQVTPVPDMFLTSLPKSLKTIAAGPKRKKLFIQSVLPIIIDVNRQIRRDRRKLQSLINQPIQNWSTEEQLWISDQYQLYRVTDKRPETLRTHIDEIPTSIALAMSALETGWGSSRFAQTGNALFGEWTWDGSGILPKQRETGKTHKIRRFDTIHQSVMAFAINLNRHRAYRHFRKMRAQQRRENGTLQPLKLMATLTAYSERGRAYVKDVMLILKSNRMTRFDMAQLPHNWTNGL